MNPPSPDFSRRTVLASLASLATAGLAGCALSSESSYLDEGGTISAGPRPSGALPRGRAWQPGMATSYSSVSGVNGRFVALTFDDGPHATNTPRLLKMLAEFNAQATFFVVGTNAQRYPQIAKQAVMEGHEIGNHSWSHPKLDQLEANSGRHAVAVEIQRTTDAILAGTGVSTRLFRPPYGAFTQSQRQWLAEAGHMPSILWSVDPEDWKLPGSSVVAQRLVSGARPGGILLAHDIHAPTVDAIPSVLQQLSAQGYRFVTVSQLIALGNATPSASAPLA